MQRDQSEVGNMEVLLSKVGASLDEFLTFKHEDALQSRDHWLENLDTNLPENGVGADAVAQLLCDEVIPFGSPVPKPGFTSFITSGAVSIGAVAQTAAAIASPHEAIFVGRSGQYSAFRIGKNPTTAFDVQAILSLS